MARIPTLEPATATPAQAALLDDVALRFGTATNMKRTLAHAPTALEALVTWYPLHAEVSTFLSEREVRLFCHAISARTDCLLCTTYFRRELIEAGEDPATFELTPAEADLVALGARLGDGGTGVPDDVHARLAARLTPPQLVLLVAFGALMVATNIVNNALDVDLDDDLLPYVAPPSAPAAGPSPAPAPAPATATATATSSS
jgi:alkylhydroperoxidase family enzyme